MTKSPIKSDFIFENLKKIESRRRRAGGAARRWRRWPAKLKLSPPRHLAQPRLLPTRSHSPPAPVPAKAAYTITKLETFILYPFLRLQPGCSCGRACATSPPPPQGYRLQPGCSCGRACATSPESPPQGYRLQPSCLRGWVRANTQSNPKPLPVYRLQQGPRGQACVTTWAAVVLPKSCLMGE